MNDTMNIINTILKSTQVGVNYRYFMVFKNRDFGIDGAYILDDFMRFMREL